MHYKNYDELINKVKNFKAMKRVVLVAAEDEHALTAVCEAKKDNIVMPILVGNKERICEILKNIDENPTDFRIEETCEKRDAVQAAIELINTGEADFIMKGKIQTADLLKGIVDKDSNLRTDSIMSHIAFFELPGYHKLLAMTDGGMIINPDLKQKVHIIENAVNVFHKMGYDNPKIAVLAAVEQVNPKMQETLDAAELRKMNQEGYLKNCVVEGPISYDLAMSKESAKIKGYTCPHTGNFDVLMVPNITSGNILGKTWIYAAGAKMAGFVVGAKIPIVLTSRGATAEEKYLSLVLSACAV